MTKIGGSVLWIERGKQTEKVVEAERAFSDEDQAKAQVLFFETKGSTAEKNSPGLRIDSGKENDSGRTEKSFNAIKERRFASPFFSHSDLPKNLS